VKILISRTYQEFETLGSLFVLEGHKKIFDCKTIELPWKDNQRNLSCIPEGAYMVEKFNSPSKGLCFHVQDVPERSAILIHKGNYATSLNNRKIDTKGCILPGLHHLDLNGDGFIDVADSTSAMNILLEKLPDIFKLIII